MGKKRRRPDRAHRHAHRRGLKTLPRGLGWQAPVHHDAESGLQLAVPSLPADFENISFSSLMHCAAQRNSVTCDISVSGLTADSFMTSSLPSTGRGTLRSVDGLYICYRS